MRVNRVVSHYKRIPDHKMINDVYEDILNRYSDTSITASELEYLLTNKWGISYVPEKIGLTALEKKAYNSKRLREKTALTAASIICTNRHGLEQYDNLSLLLDYSGTDEADEKNQIIADVMLHGSAKEKEVLFWERLKPLMNMKESGLEWKTDDELVEHWDELEPVLYQFVVLDGIIKEAKQAGMEFAPDVTAKIEMIHAKGKLPAQMILCRAGLIANAYYGLINDGDLRKIDCNVLKEIKGETVFSFRDYLEDTIFLKERYEKNIAEQLGRKLGQLGYKNIEDAALANIRGKEYNTKEAMEVLQAGRLVYVLDKNRKLSQGLELVGTDGFLKPVSTRKKEIYMKDYLEEVKNLVDKLLEEGQPLSVEGQLAARRYMATMVCFEKLMNERKLGNIRLWQAIGNNEKKFSKAVDDIIRDERFQSLTKEITIEGLGEFIKNKGEKHLNERYTSMIVADNHKRAAEEIYVR